jgi:CheY-like chemotaxis protein
MKILVIDDEPLVRMSIQRAAQARGHIVETAEDGLTGLEMWRKSDPDVVYLDVIMPGLSGPAVLKEMGPAVRAKVILISAYMGDLKSSQEALPEGVSLFIAKPFQDIFNVIKQSEEVFQT